jgi:hypothetical protein
MIDKATRFYLGALQEAGLTVSPHFKTRGARALGPRRPNKSRPSGKRGSKGKDDDGNDEPFDPKATERFQVPIPNKPAATITIPKDLTAADWTMLKAMIEAYIARLQKPKS